MTVSHPPSFWDPPTALAFLTHFLPFRERSPSRKPSSCINIGWTPFKISILHLICFWMEQSGSGEFMRSISLEPDLSLMFCHLFIVLCLPSTSAPSWGLQLSDALGWPLTAGVDVLGNEKKRRWQRDSMGPWCLWKLSQGRRLWLLWRLWSTALPPLALVWFWFLVVSFQGVCRAWALPAFVPGWLIFCIEFNTGDEEGDRVKRRYISPIWI